MGSQKNSERFNGNNLNQADRPWLDPKGKLYSDDALREISKTWDSYTWERFLRETVDHPQREQLLEDHLQTAQTDERWLDEVYEDTELSSRIRLLIRDHLTPRQQHVIRLIFWKSKSEREVAEMLGVSRGSVVVIKRQSLSKLKSLIESRIHHSPIGKRKNRNQPKGETQMTLSSEDAVCADIKKMSS